jgi:hypothetical protein
VLDEDESILGIDQEDEIYGKLILINLSTGTKIEKKTNQINHSF